jgi:septal ring factor EnvC (AmiA/AmiB activator)
MNYRAAIACLLVVSSPLAIAAQQTQTKAAQADPAAVARAKVAAVQGQVQAEDVNVRQLKARVDALESDTQAASRQLNDRDRKIAELERQLDAQRKP